MLVLCWRFRRILLLLSLIRWPYYVQFRDIEACLVHGTLFRVIQLALATLRFDQTELAHACRGSLFFDRQRRWFVFVFFIRFMILVLVVILLFLFDGRAFTFFRH